MALFEMTFSNKIFQRDILNTDRQMPVDYLHSNLKDHDKLFHILFI